MKIQKWFVALAAANGLAATAVGARAAHGLRATLEPGALVWIATGTRYQMYAAFGLLACAWLAGGRRGWEVQAAGWSFVGGALLFSCVLYAMALGGPAALGQALPVGGSLFLAAWLLLGLSARKIQG